MVNKVLEWLYEFWSGFQGYGVATTVLEGLLPGLGVASGGLEWIPAF